MVDFGNYQMDDEKFYASYRMVYGKPPEEQSILLNELYKKKKKYLEGLTLWNTDSSPWSSVGFYMTQFRFEC
jgi:hypothetical protein